MKMRSFDFTLVFILFFNGFIGAFHLKRQCCLPELLPSRSASPFRRKYADPRFLLPLTKKESFNIDEVTNSNESIKIDIFNLGVFLSEIFLSAL
jgi:hypothetical protein